MRDGQQCQQVRAAFLASRVASAPLGGSWPTESEVDEHLSVCDACFEMTARHAVFWDHLSEGIDGVTSPAREKHCQSKPLARRWERAALVASVLLCLGLAVHAASLASERDGQGERLASMAERVEAVESKVQEASLLATSRADQIEELSRKLQRGEKQYALVERDLRELQAHTRNPFLPAPSYGFSGSATYIAAGSHNFEQESGIESN